MELDRFNKQDKPASADLQRTKESLQKLLTLREQVNDLRNRHRTQYPGILIDVFDIGSGYAVVADVPGVSADKLELAIADNQLYIAGRRDVTVSAMPQSVPNMPQGAPNTSQSVPNVSQADSEGVMASPEAQAPSPVALLQERYRGAFERTVEFPEAINPHGVQTNLHHGVLTLYIPKQLDCLPSALVPAPNHEVQ